MNSTDPSPSRKLDAPGCRLPAVMLTRLTAQNPHEWPSEGGTWISEVCAWRDRYARATLCSGYVRRRRYLESKRREVESRRVKDGARESDRSIGLFADCASNAFQPVEQTVRGQESPLIDENRVGCRGQGQSWSLRADPSRTGRRRLGGAALTVLTSADRLGEDPLVKAGEKLGRVVFGNDIVGTIRLNSSGRSDQASPERENHAGSRPGPSLAV
jgi:hypothetical protein